MTLASGTRVSVRYVRERVPGTTPAGLSTPAVSLKITNDATPGEGTIERATGSFIDDGYEEDQVVRVTGFTAAANNTDYKVKTVTDATHIVVYEFNGADAIVTDNTVFDTDAEIRVVFSTLRATGRNINLEKDVLESEEVRSDRQIADVRHGFNRVVGSPGFELSRGAYDDMLEAALSGKWKRVLMTGTPNITVVATSTTVTITRDAGSWITDGFREGHFVLGSGFTAGNNNTTPIRISSLTATVLTCIQATTNGWVSESSAVRTVNEHGWRLDIGTTLRQFTFERAFLDVMQFQAFKGVAIDQLGTQVQPAAIVGGTMNVLGMSAAAMAATSLSSVNPRAAPQNSPFDAFTGALYEGGTLIAVVTGFNPPLANNRSLEAVVGSRFSPAVFEGRARISGDLTLFFENEVMFNKFVNETESKLWLALVDAASPNDFLNIILPRVKYTGGAIDPPQEGPITLEMPLLGLVKEGLAEPGGLTTTSSMTIQRSNVAILQ